MMNALDNSLDRISLSSPKNKQLRTPRRTSADRVATRPPRVADAILVVLQRPMATRKLWSGWSGQGACDLFHHPNWFVVMGYRQVSFGNQTWQLKVPYKYGCLDEISSINRWYLALPPLINYHRVKRVMTNFAGMGYQPPNQMRTFTDWWRLNFRGYIMASSWNQTMDCPWLGQSPFCSYLRFSLTTGKHLAQNHIVALHRW